jgi:hypothetical protein
MCRANEELATVVGRNIEAYDFLPVLDENSPSETIIGLIELSPYSRGERPSGYVKDRMSSLSEMNLIAADASIHGFLKEADRHRCRLVIKGSEVSGIVGLSDLQRLPVRAALFALITNIEISMADAIRRECEGSEGWLDRLSPDRRTKVINQKNKAIKADTFVESLLFTQFMDKVTIIRGSPLFSGEWEQFDEQFGRIRALRNELAHANNYASTQSRAIKVCETVRMIDFWSDRLAGWPGSP